MGYTFFPDSIALEKYDASVSKITSQLKKNSQKQHTRGKICNTLKAR